MIKCLNVIFLATLISLPCAAGWISSGGESFRYEKNPWFVKNTETVKYCISIDETTISVPASSVKNLVAASFSYWKSELHSKETGKGFTPIASQNFVLQTACDATTDIEFKIGYGTLAQDEIEFLKDPTLYIGVGIQKEYDEVNLRGKGIIYISSDKGTHAYRNSGNLVTEGWSKPKLLQYALLHEVGHVMGLPHLGVGIMAETFLTNVLNINGWTFFADQPYLSFTQPLAVAEVCMPDINDVFNPGFFGVDSSQKCLRLERAEGSSTEWAVSSRIEKGAALKQVGLLKITNSSDTPMSQKPVIFVYLPDAQTVFKKSDLGFADFLVGALTNSSIYQGIFTAAGSHKPDHVQINVDSESIIVSGVVNNQIVPVFNHTLPSLKGIVFP